MCSIFNRHFNRSKKKMIFLCGNKCEIYRDKKYIDNLEYKNYIYIKNKL
jgi:hypothetical protein